MCRETFRHALNSLAAVAPDWLSAHSSADWVARYGHRVEEYRLPAGEQKRVAYEVIGADGLLLLEAIDGPDKPIWLQTLPAIDLLRQVWEQNYQVEAGRAYWRSSEQIPAGRDSLRRFGRRRPWRHTRSGSGAVNTEGKCLQINEMELSNDHRSKCPLNNGLGQVTGITSSVTSGASLAASTGLGRPSNPARRFSLRR